MVFVYNHSFLFRPCILQSGSNDGVLAVGITNHPFPLYASSRPIHKGKENGFDHNRRLSTRLLGADVLQLASEDRSRARHEGTRTRHFRR